MQSEMLYEPVMPALRKGWKGRLDRLIGPGATPAELVLQLVPAAVAAIAAPLYASTLPIDWSPWQLGAIAGLEWFLLLLFLKLLVSYLLKESPYHPNPSQ